MAGYITLDEYRKLSPLNTILESDFEAISSIASDVVDSYVFNAIRDYCLMEREDAAELIKKAVARQIDFIQAQGGMDAYLGKTERRPVSSYSVSVGNTSESESYGTAAGGASSGVTGEGLLVSPIACAYLKRIQAIGRMIGRSRRCV